MSAHHTPDAFDILPCIKRSRERAGKLFVGLDFDGTLADIVPRPADAVLAPGAAQTLDRLGRRTDTTLAVVTGRGIEDARRRVGIDSISYAGNHGLDIEGPGTSWVHPEAAAARGQLDTLLKELQREFAGRDDVILENKRVSMSVHFRTVTDNAEQARIIERVHAAAARVGSTLRLGDGSKVVEIKPAVDWDKGRALVSLRSTLHLDDAPALFIGDDRTDEDAFRELTGPDDAGIIVGRERLRDTKARAVLDGITDVIRFLDALAA